MTARQQKELIENVVHICEPVRARHLIGSLHSSGELYHTTKKGFVPCSWNTIYASYCCIQNGFTAVVQYAKEKDLIRKTHCLLLMYCNIAHVQIGCHKYLIGTMQPVSFYNHSTQSLSLSGITGWNSSGKMYVQYVETSSHITPEQDAKRSCTKWLP